MKHFVCETLDILLHRSVSCDMYIAMNIIL